jgi:hypothetical protein
MTTTMIIIGAGPLRRAAGRPIGRARRRLAVLLRALPDEYLGCLDEYFLVTIAFSGSLLAEYCCRRDFDGCFLITFLSDEGIRS